MQIRLPHVALIGVLALTVTGVANATIPGSTTGVYTGCYAKSSGALRVIDFEANGLTCTNNEKPMGWHATGPKGATGPQGPAGPKGATGPQGPAGKSFARGHFRTGWFDASLDYETFATVDLPAGLYSLAGKANLYNEEMPVASTWATVSCRLLQKAASGAQTVHDITRAEVGDDYNEHASVSLLGLAEVPAGQTDKLHLQCKDDGGVGGYMTQVSNVKVLAQEVGGYTKFVN
jgi:hypothetical protein